MRAKSKKNKAIKPVKKNSLILYFVLLTVLVIIGFSRTSNFEAVDLDDARLIFENPLVTNPDIPYSACFSKFIYNVHYKPLVFLTWKAQYQLLGDSPSHFHTLNWLLHLANALLIMQIFLLLFRKLYSDEKKIIFSAFALALLFAVNPLRIESVVWLTERKDVLFAFFFLLGWLMYIFYLEKKNYAFLLFASIFYLSSGLSKSMGLTLIMVLFLIDIWYSRKIQLKLFLEKIPFIIVFFVLLFVYGMLESKTAVEINTLAGVRGQGFEVEKISNLSFINELPYALQWFFTTSARFVLWVFHILIPLKLSVIYPHDAIFGFLGYSIFIIPFVIIAAYFFIWKKKLTKHAILGGLLFFAITIAPALALTISGKAIFLSDRYTYIPSIGIFFALVILLNKIEFKSVKYYSVFGILFLFYFAGNLKNIKHWENSENLFKQALKISPESSLAYHGLGRYYRNQNELQKAIEAYNNGIKYENANPSLYLNRGEILFELGQPENAIEDYNKTIELNPMDANAFNNRGIAYGKINKLDNALTDLNKALEINPNFADAYSNRGNVYYFRKEYAKIIDDYNKYLEFVPADENVIFRLGLAYIQLKDYNKAIQFLTQAINLNPQNGFYYLNRSSAYNSLGNKTNALQDAVKAQQLGQTVNTNYLNSLSQ